MELIIGTAIAVALIIVLILIGVLLLIQEKAILEYFRKKSHG